ncbi:unnamed protein product [Symbiodinium natans]|uniref:Nitronate monooxygenase domain-containing protein n=1 Tax=Symbiodinium natans TaxID=878477 RepID=A0A812KJM1_9DINO|nr:unnamed protein product [Symbiodinium natans]
MVLKTKLTEALGIKLDPQLYRRIHMLLDPHVKWKALYRTHAGHQEDPGEGACLAVTPLLAGLDSLHAEMWFFPTQDVFGQVADLFQGPAFEEGEQWRALTRIKVRKEPSVKAPQLEDKVIEKGAIFYVAEKRRAKIPTGGKHRLYLRLAAGTGWVFDLGVAGEWQPSFLAALFAPHSSISGPRYGKPIAEPVYEDLRMHYVGYAEMAAAVSNAGGLGIITALTVAQPPKGKEALRDEIRKCRQLTDKPFGVNITLLPVGVPPDFDGIVQVLIEEKIKVVETAGRNPEKVIKQCKDAGMFVIHKCVAVRHALTAQKMGADMISMDGFDCGGHPGEEDVGNWVLLAQAAQELSIPFVASGGTATGTQLAAALAMGAEGVNMGTRFMATKEAPIVQPMKDVMVKAKVTDTTHVFRSLKNTERVYKNKTANEAPMAGHAHVSGLALRKRRDRLAVERL